MILNVIDLKEKILFIVILFFSTVTSFSQTEEMKLEATLKDFHQALVEKNTASINQHTDKALSYGHSTGMVETKNELIDHLLAETVKYISYSEDSLHMLINGSMANARFIAKIEVDANGTIKTMDLAVLEVWVKKGPRWILFARQAVRKN